MYCIIDNYDSFVYNLVAYLQELGQEVLVLKNDRATPQEIAALRPRGILLSPGPKTPARAGISVAVVQTLGGKIPILGVCLGHQVIAHAFGASVAKGTHPMHGKVTPILHHGRGLFDGIPSPYTVTRYHSLTVQADTLPETLRVDAVDAAGTVMAVSHTSLPIYGVQFHPEAVLSEYGHQLLKNYLRICEKWWFEHA